jgi:Tfp pilus assembly protein PilN
MIRVNLLPEKVRNAEGLKTDIILAAIALALVAGGIGYLYQQGLSGLHAIQKERAAVDAEKNSPELKKMVADVEEFAKQDKNFHDQLANLNRFREKQVFFVKLLDMLPDLVPDNAYLTDVNEASNKGAITVTIKGNAMTPDDVSKFYMALESQGFKNLSLDSPASPGTVLGETYYGFTISFDYGG